MLEVISDEVDGIKVLCKCECGNTKWINKYNLKQGKSKSCGCIQKEIAKNLAANLDSTTHGKSHTKLYKVWCGMKCRCYTKNTPYYINYGGRGITVCEEWKNDFSVFEKWALENGYAEGLTIERINNNGNYEPGNCTWITKQQQDVNKRTNIYFYVSGNKVTMEDVSRFTGIPANTLHYRYHVHRKTTYEEVIQPMVKRRR